MVVGTVSLLSPLSVEYTSRRLRSKTRTPERARDGFVRWPSGLHRARCRKLRHSRQSWSTTHRSRRKFGSGVGVEIIALETVPSRKCTMVEYRLPPAVYTVPDQTQSLL